MKEQSWSIHAEFVILLVTLIGGFYLLDGKIERQGERQGERTDKLYEMFCSLQSQMKDEIIEIRKDMYESRRNQKNDSL